MMTPFRTALLAQRIGYYPIAGPPAPELDGAILFGMFLDGEPPIGDDTARLNELNGQPVYEFNDDFNWRQVFRGFAPTDYAGGNIIIVVPCRFPSTATGTSFELRVEIERQQAGMDPGTDSFAAAVDSGPIALGTPEQLKYVSFTLSQAQADGIVANDMFRLRLTRMGLANADDDVNDSLFVYGIQVRGF